MDYDALKKLAMLQVQRNKQGILNPEPTPEENDYVNSLTAAVAGSLSPVNNMERIAGDTAKEALKRNLLNQAVETGAEMPAVQRAQQALSREADFAQRARQQRFDRLKSLFNK